MSGCRIPSLKEESPGSAVHRARALPGPIRGERRPSTGDDNMIRGKSRKQKRRLPQSARCWKPGPCLALGRPSSHQRPSWRNVPREWSSLRMAPRPLAGSSTSRGAQLTLANSAAVVSHGVRFWPLVTLPIDPGFRRRRMPRRTFARRN